MATKAASPTAAIAAAPITCGETHAYVTPPQAATSSTLVTATVRVAAPAKSRS
jgi:hypothetical protein